MPYSLRHGLFACIENHGRVSVHGETMGRGKTGRTRTDDRNRFAGCRVALEELAALFHGNVWA